MAKVPHGLPLVDGKIPVDGNGSWLQRPPSKVD